MAESLAALFALADAYVGATHVSESTLSGLVLKGGNRLRDLRAGKGDIGIKRVATAIQWFSDHWPAGALWPALIARPAPQPVAASEDAAPTPEPA